MKPIGIFGGTFDPVHLGHIRLALEVKEQLGFSEVRMIPCNIPPHRERPVASARQRLAMLKLAVNASEGLSVDDREVRRAGVSYMVDTLTALRADYEDVPLCLILGFDAFKSLNGWNRWKQLFDYTHVVVMDRPGSAESLNNEVAATVERRSTENYMDLHQHLGGRIYFATVSQLEISSTHIRAMLGSGELPHSLVPSVLFGMGLEGIYKK